MMSNRARNREAFWFFYRNAGYSYNPKTQTPKQGRAAGARLLAMAERYAHEHGWRAEWADDWSVGSHKDYYGADSAYAENEPSTCETCTLYDADGNVLASLGCIDDASNEYRRVIRAELALEAKPKPAKK